MVVWLLLFLAWTLELEVIPVSVTDFSHSYELMCITGHLEK